MIQSVNQLKQSRPKCSTGDITTVARSVPSAHFPTPLHNLYFCTAQNHFLMIAIGFSMNKVDYNHVICRHYCRHASTRGWRALASICRAIGCFSNSRETSSLALPQTESVRLQGPMLGPSAGQVRRNSGPPRVRTQLSNQETQILMTTLNGPISAAADDCEVALSTSNGHD